MVTLQSFASTVITEPSPCEEKQETPFSLDGLEKDITIDPKKIEVMLFANVPIRKVSFEFQIPNVMERQANTGKKSICCEIGLALEYLTRPSKNREPIPHISVLGSVRTRHSRSEHHHHNQSHEQIFLCPYPSDILFHKRPPDKGQ
jgi:hypothetical protein